MNIVGIIQARLGSRRLPGKMLMHLLGQPAIHWVVHRLRRSELCHQLVVATSIHPRDDALAAWCHDHHVAVFRGPERDVLARYYRCACMHEATHIVRITGDCPLLDWRVVDQVIKRCVEDPHVQYATNCEPATFPEGMSAEVLPMSVLQQTHWQARSPFDREHVTPFVRFAPDKFRHAVVSSEPDYSRYRLTVDYREDVVALNALMENMHAQGILEDASTRCIVNALEQHPDLVRALAEHERDLWRAELKRKELDDAA